MDMDGVLVHEESALPGADRFLARLSATGTPFLVLTNNSIYTRRDLSARLRASGIEVPEDSIWTSALATARFLENQRPGGSAFVIGEAGLPRPERRNAIDGELAGALREALESAADDAQVGAVI